MTVDVCRLVSLRPVLAAVLALLGAASTFAQQPQYGWIVGAEGTILRTTDGGLTWTAQNSGVTDTLREIAAIDSQRAWVVGGQGRVLKTTDGGATWTSVPASTTGAPAVGGLWSVVAPTADAIRITGTGTDNFRYSNDGGVTWAGPTSGYTGGNSLEAKFLDANTGWVVGIFRDVRKTTNGGATWTQQYSSAGSRDIYAVDFVDAQNGWAGGQNQRLYRTINGGTTWAEISVSVPTRWQGIDFINATTGWMVGTSGMIYKSTDGQNIVQQTSGTINQLIDVQFYDANTGWVVGGVGTVLKTTNGGTNWAAVSTGKTVDFYGIAFANPSSVDVTVNSAPSGLLFNSSGTGCASGTGYSTSKTLNWSLGATCSLSFGTPQSAGAGKQYVFSKWEDNSTNPSRSISAPSSATTYTATFQTQYQLTTGVNGSGTVSPATGFQNEGPVTVTATPSCSVFTGWTGATVTAGQVNLTAPTTLTANFSSPTAATAAKGSLQSVRGVANRFRQSVSVQNTTGAPADVSIVISNLGAGATLVTPASATGTTTSCSGAAGRSFYTVTGVAAGAFATVTFEFNAASAGAVTFTAAGLVGAGPR